MAEHLPSLYSSDQIFTLLSSTSIPRPASVEALKVTAAFHIIYVLSYTEKHTFKGGWEAPSSNFDLILRIAGDHVPGYKTNNEAGAISWLSQKTTIPVPHVIAYDNTTSNSLKREYIILNRCSGVAVSDIYATLTSTQLDQLMFQLIELQNELLAHPFDSIGGLVVDPSTQGIIPGPVMDETLWFDPDIAIHFPGDTFEGLNIAGPYPDYTTFVLESVRKYMYLISRHPSLSFLRPYLPALEALLVALPSYQELNRIPIHLAHKDLHFANILCDPSTLAITAILDWEFASTVPDPLWDPSKAFLWNGKDGEAALKEKYRLRDRFWELCEEKGLHWNMEADKDIWEDVEKVRVSLRRMTGFLPRGIGLSRIPDWEDEMLTGLRGLGFENLL